MSASVEDSLTYLEHLLSNLPDTVLSTGNIYDFQGFLSDPRLHSTMCWKSRTYCTEPIDKGPGLVAVVPVLICDPPAVIDHRDGVMDSELLVQGVIYKFKKIM